MMERCRKHIPQKINKRREHKTLDYSLKVRNNGLVPRSSETFTCYTFGT